MAAPSEYAPERAAPLIAERALAVVDDDGRHGAAVRLYQPVPGDQCWVCRIELVGFEVSRRHAISGEDSFQALQLAMRLIPTLVAASSEYREGRLACFDVVDFDIEEMFGPLVWDGPKPEWP